MNNKIDNILQVIWSSGGFAFGGTARDLLRGEVPNDLDVRLGNYVNDIPQIKALGAHVENDRASDHGEAYYDKQIIFSDGLKIHIKYGFCSVTDCDINLVKLYRNKLELLYVPQYLYLHQNPLLVVLKNIQQKQFHPLEECEPHRQYRWDEFVNRGWTKI